MRNNVESLLWTGSNVGNNPRRATVNSSGGAKARQKSPSQEGRPQSQEGAGTAIRLDTQLVNVLFGVTDKQNRYINDLTASDVKALEEGKPQEIFTFKREKLAERLYGRLSDRGVFRPFSLRA